MKRRRLLQLGLTVAGVAAAGGVTYAFATDTQQTGALLTSDVPMPERFKVRLPIPETAKPVKDGHYAFTQRPRKVEIIPGTKTEIWGYDGQFPGPTLDLRRGEPVTVTVANKLDVPTSTHLHGGVTAADSDGFPTDLVVPKGHGGHFKPGRHSHMKHDPSAWKLHTGQRDYGYSLDQPAATLWYHDHRMDFTAPQVWRGLAGFCIVRDDVDDALPLPKGERDIPLMLCDRAFHADGAFKYPSKDGTLMGEPGVSDEYHEGVLGDVMLVNGAPWPVLDVDAARYRLRFLNASNARRYELALDNDAPLVHIGSDVGLLDKPRELSSLVLASAERAEVIVDFSKYKPGTEITLVNKLGADDMAEVMRFRVGDKVDDDSSIPDELVPFKALKASDAVTERTFKFEYSSVSGHGSMWTINGEAYDPGGSMAKIKLGTVEKWTLISDVHHPVHAHLGHFQVLSRDGKPPRDTDAGWKDTVDMRPLEVVEVLIKFEGYKGRYMLHCHNLEHEDMAMMANFDVV
ncbi:multicopper oxidase family protein [Stackebrandtia nassauensis]|uniref:Bilirubin oxidase n=1 Tax=Stackebrandtia nassauensis (strain DSM 44728 / CIP 108903 / NRRL B-16338 / NBRC 102104 / LLR-40K-21) TaxID=446470 RepID=D3Q6Q9_STANL|nr:multicopper oxidase domain-containing protein [Stackebrandtia nassauensis]ADD44302.1 Bilirubin oxidase [Stackebrandtia nassauensis DSM 44728]